MWTKLERVNKNWETIHMIPLDSQEKQTLVTDSILDTAFPEGRDEYPELRAGRLIDP